jgi:hypothetical protein
MSVPNTSISPDGLYSWDGTAWCSTLSPDGAFRWDGSEWRPVADAPTGAPATGTGTFEFAGALDGSPYGDGHHPDPSPHLPDGATYDDGIIAVGPGWLGVHGTLHWRCLQTADLRSVALVGPTALTDVSLDHSIEAPKPDLALRDSAGRLLRIEIDKIAPAARSAILQAVGTGADVTRAAEGFLAYGYLPGDWGKQYHAGFWRF